MNGALIKELRELEKSDELPARVTNRLVLTAIIQLYEKVEAPAKLKSKVSRLEGITSLLGLMWIALLGWVMFGS